MKNKIKLFTIIALMSINVCAFANFIEARVKVTGITCSMCSNSVHKALSTLNFIEKIDVDLENAVFNLTFKEGQPVTIDDIKNKIEGAGFSVGELVADFNFENISVSKDFHYEFAGNTYHFINVKDQQLNDKVSLKFVDKGLTSQKEYKKFASLTSMACIKNGKPAKCCPSTAKRIYHVTI